MSCDCGPPKDGPRTTTDATGRSLSTSPAPVLGSAAPLRRDRPMELITGRLRPERGTPLPPPDPSATGLGIPRGEGPDTIPPDPRSSRIGGGVGRLLLPPRRPRLPTHRIAPPKGAETIERQPETIHPLYVQRAIERAGKTGRTLQRPYWNGGSTTFARLPDGTLLPL